MTDRLSPLDASFLEIEEQHVASHMHIGWAMVFAPLPEGGAPRTGAPAPRGARAPTATPHDLEVVSEAIETSVAELGVLARTPDTHPPPAVRRRR